MAPDAKSLDMSGCEELPDRVAESFSGQTVLITGGTGFMGKVLVEKLLRKCIDIKQILLLVRNKKGKTPTERLVEIFNGALFEKVVTMHGGVERLLEKVSVLEGDCSEPDLALTPAGRQQVVDQVDIIIHAAATIRFDEELRKAILLNVRGTKLVLELGKSCKHLKLFVHISTAYCHLHEKLLEERAYPPPHDPHRVIGAAEMLDSKALNLLRDTLLDKIPNSYAFTKSLAEGLAVEAMAEMPVVVLRPSIVIPVWKEPVPGWTDNINGPTGLLIGAGKGVLRSMYCRSDSYADYLPVDVFISGIMVVAWNYLSYGDKKSTIFNFTSSAEVKLTWKELIDTGKEVIMNRIPLNGVVWYPGGSMKHNRTWHLICTVFQHWLPAVLVDILLFCLRYEPVLCRVQRRINKGFEVFEYYTTNQWDFKSEVGQMVRNRLNAKERDYYKVDAEGLDITKYFEDCVHAARIFILKETDDTIPAAKRHMKIMKVVDVIFRMLFTCFIAWMFLKLSMSIFSTSTPSMAPSAAITM